MQQRTPAFCTQCRSRCGCVAVVDEGRLLGIEPLLGHPSGDKLCPKGRAAADLVYHADRIMRPMRRTNPKGAADPGWRPISWDEALVEISARLGAIARDHGPEQVAFSVTTPSGSHISDSISWIERFIRAFGSPNTIYSTEVCNWHKDFASRFTYGHDIGTPDFANTDCIVLWGNNPSATWLARTTEIQKGLKRGARLLVVDPKPTVFARRATQWLQIRPGMDLYVALGLINLLIRRERFDSAYAARWTNGALLVRDDTGRFLRESDVLSDGRAHVLLARSVESGSLVPYDPATRIFDNTAGAPELRCRGEIETQHGNVACRTAFDVLAEAAAEMPPERVAELSGVAPDDLARAADVISDARSVAYYAWNGVGQSTIATQTDRAISILYALTGSYGRAGGNVPGGTAVFADISGRDLMPEAQRAKALGFAERPLGPGLNGWVTARDTYRAILDGKPYPVRALISFGTNALASHPDPDVGRRALTALDFHVHADFFVNASAKYADIILPVATSWEREGLRTGFDVSLDGLRRVQLRPAVIAPTGEAKSDTDIVMALADKLGLGAKMFGLDADAGHNAVLASTGLTVEALRAKPEGVELETQVALDAHEQIVDGHPRGFPTPTGLIEIYSERLQEIGQPAVPRADPSHTPVSRKEFPLVLGSAKSMIYCHSQHRNIGALRRLMPDPILEMSRSDAEARAIKQGDWVEVRTAAGTAVAKAAVVAELVPGSVFGQHGWWVEGADGTPYGPDRPLAASLNNVITTAEADPVSGSIPLRCSPCEVSRLGPATRASVRI
jgi:anaerobic selenocysteine-containing dehydrogenase